MNYYLLVEHNHGSEMAAELFDLFKLGELFNS